MIHKPTQTPNAAQDQASHPSEIRIAAAVEAAYILDAVRR
jgi:hypothetical protein